jgi:hypothetical protein
MAVAILALVALTVGLVAGHSALPFFQSAATPHAGSIPVVSPAADFSHAGGGACIRLGRHPSAPFQNVPVTDDTFLAHSEPDIAENSANPLDLVGGSKYFTDPKHYVFQIGYDYSVDGGCSWHDGGLLPGFAQKGLVSDVSFAFGPNNRVYVSVLFTGRNSAESGIAVLTSTDGGQTFGRPTIVFDDPTGRTFSDKPWIAVDTAKGPYHGNVYEFWSYDHGAECGQDNSCFQELAFSRSVDGGKTFSPVRLVEGHNAICTNAVPGRPAGSTLCDSVLGATPAVEADGTLAVAYAYMDVLAGAPNHQNIPTKMLVQTSSDGGQTWTAPVLAATIHDTPFQLRPDRFRNFSLPAFATDPAASGWLYLAWADEQQNQANIMLASSGDSGQTWSTPVQVNDDPVGDGANHAQPALAVAPDGVVSVSFFDTRNDPTHHLLDVYLAQSTSHGMTFLPNVRVTTQSIDPSLGTPLDGSGTPFFGDYQGLAADNLFVHLLWNDTRTGVQQLVTAAIPSAQPGTTSQSVSRQ